MTFAKTQDVIPCFQNLTPRGIQIRARSRCSAISKGRIYDDHVTLATARHPPTAKRLRYHPVSYRYT